MTVATFVLLAIPIALFLYAVLIYNGLVRLKHNIAQAWSNIDVLLKQRHDELPKLVEVCRQYMRHERDTFDRITQARSAVGRAREAADVPGVSAAESALHAGLARLFAVAENYPELRADENFQHLQNRISGLEAQIADRRELYNDCVNANNVRIEQFRDNAVATLFRFTPHPLLKIKHSERADVDVKALFTS